MLVKTIKSIEECWILTGQRRGGVWLLRRRSYSTGQPASVTFNAAWVLAREELRGDVLGFLHTHPSGLPRPSARDVRTMRAWCTAFGKPLLCLIAAKRGMAGYVFDGEEVDEAVRIVHFDRGAMVVVE
jgi:proteasome lid subunit RPN8/RPN11